MNAPLFPSLFEGYAWLEGHINLERRLGSVAYSEEAFGLEGFRQRLARLGNPQSGLRTIHIAGTRGKGSAALILEALLRADGASVATFTSPHIYEFRERIRLNGAPVGARQFLEGLEKLTLVAEEVVTGHPTGFKTVFENLTALFFMTARDARVDWAIVEAGLGGRLDATNAIDAGPVLLTRIGLEHTQLLGDTIEKIAAEKAAILKSGGWGVFGRQENAKCKTGNSKCKMEAEFESLGQSGAAGVFRKRSLEVGAELASAQEICPIRAVEAHREGLRVTIGFEGDDVLFELPLLGPFQAENLQNALAMLSELRERAWVKQVPVEKLKQALAGIRIPGRMERASATPELIVDAAHCPTGAAALAAAMEAHFGLEPADLIIGMMGDKDHAGVLAALAGWPGWRQVYCYQLETPRALDAGRLTALARRHFPTAENCINLAYALESWDGAPDKQRRAIATGTLYSVGHLLDWGRKRVMKDGPFLAATTAAQSQPDSRNP